ncbi:unnamed protein product, partial [Effrenium voratum]
DPTSIPTAPLTPPSSKPLLVKLSTKPAVPAPATPSVVPAEPLTIPVEPFPAEPLVERLPRPAALLSESPRNRGVSVSFSSETGESRAADLPENQPQKRLAKDVLRPEAKGRGSPKLEINISAVEQMTASQAQLDDLQRQAELFWAGPLGRDAARCLPQTLPAPTEPGEGDWVQVLLWQEEEIARLLADNARFRTHLKFQETQSPEEMRHSQCIGQLIEDLLSVPQRSSSPERDTSSVPWTLTARLSPSLQSQLRRQGPATVAFSLLQELQQLQLQALRRHKAAKEAADAWRLRRLLAKCHRLMQEKARLSVSTPRTPRATTKLPRQFSEPCFDEDSLYRRGV